jgi:tetratricopeptide (TPR) repeat protein
MKSYRFFLFIAIYLIGVHVATFGATDTVYIRDTTLNNKIFIDKETYNAVLENSKNAIQNLNSNFEAANSHLNQIIGFIGAAFVLVQILTGISNRRAIKEYQEELRNAVSRYNTLNSKFQLSSQELEQKLPKLEENLKQSTEIISKMDDKHNAALKSVTKIDDSIQKLISEEEKITLKIQEHWDNLEKNTKDSSTQVSPEIQELFDEAIKFFVNQNHEEGRLLLKRVLKEKPNSFGAWYNLGLSYARTRQYEESIEAFKVILSLNHQNLIDKEVDIQLHPVYRNIAQGYYFLKDHDSAIKFIDKAIELKQIPLDLNLKGKYLYRKGDFLGAYQYYKLYLEQKPDDINTIQLLARISRILKIENAPEMYYERARLIAPDNASVIELGRELEKSKSEIS